MKNIPKSELLLGNAAIAWGLARAGVDFVSSYPGTPSTEILPGVVKYKKLLDLPIYTEWSLNERIAYELAYTAALTGKRSAVSMKQVGLNVAADPLFSSAYTGVKGGFLILVADDPGPHSSQTEQDSRFWGRFAKLPVLDPSSPKDAIELIEHGFEISEKYGTPVIIRPSLRVCHATQLVEYGELLPRAKTENRPKAAFKKDRPRWAAIPADRFRLHQELNEKLGKLSGEWDSADNRFNPAAIANGAKSAIVASGIEHALVEDVLRERDLLDKVSLMKVSTVNPLPVKQIGEFAQKHSNLLVLEDTMPVIESVLLENGIKTKGRKSGYVPLEGELTHEKVAGLVLNHIEEIPEIHTGWVFNIGKKVDGMEIRDRKPTLCAGCGHRAAFYSIRKSFPKGIYTSDIGCYTLGINLGAVDTCLNMGAAISMAAGFSKSYASDMNEGDLENLQPVVATMGDSTFFHSGISTLASAVYNKSRFILVLLDNRITAMTGMQPAAHSGILADGDMGIPLDLVQAVRGTGVKFVEKVDPYDLAATAELLEKAWQHMTSPDGSVAVVIAEHPCMINDPGNAVVENKTIEITEDCNGCGLCVTRFECPALVLDRVNKKVTVDIKLCVSCGVCSQNICPRNAIRIREK